MGMGIKKFNKLSETTIHNERHIVDTEERKLAREINRSKREIFLQTVNRMEKCMECFGYRGRGKVSKAKRNIFMNRFGPIENIGKSLVFILRRRKNGIKKENS